MTFRVLSGLMAGLFALAVAVQYNDPDPGRWMALYGAAAAVACAGVADAGTYWHMFDAWEMKNAPIEEAREASGLRIVFVWMAGVAVHWIVTYRSSRATSF